MSPDTSESYRIAGFDALDLSYGGHEKITVKSQNRILKAKNKHDPYDQEHTFVFSPPRCAKNELQPVYEKAHYSKTLNVYMIL